MGLMTTDDLLKHLKNEGDCAHTAVCTYLEKLNTFSQGHARQNASVNSKRNQIQRKRRRRRRRRRRQLQH
jgi:hypothetical protein